jgi:ketosteroid isomerase-like protein
MANVESTIIDMEKAALVRWGNGDPTGFLEITAEDIVYFDPYTERRIDGLSALRQYYQALWGKIHFDRFELLNPRVQVCGDMAVLTFNYVSYTGTNADRWNCTENYRKSRDGHWLIVQTHWSYTEVFKNKMKA